MERRSRRGLSVDCCTARQSRTMSMVEAVTNVVVGYLLALGLLAVLFPALGLHVSFGENLLISAAFTAISIVRSFILRRLFESLRWNKP